MSNITDAGRSHNNDNMANVLYYVQITFIQHMVVKLLLIKNKFLLKRVCNFGHSQSELKCLGV